MSFRRMLIAVDNGPIAAHAADVGHGRGVQRALFGSVADAVMQRVATRCPIKQDRSEFSGPVESILDITTLPQ